MQDDDDAIRPARPGDGAAVALYIHEAGGGLPRHIWQGMAGPGESWQEVGARRMDARAERGGFWVADEGDGPVAAILGHRLPDEPEPIGPDMDPVMRPLQELENLVPATWYINMLATDPACRGRGWGRRLLAFAGRQAAREGITGLSLITGDLALEARRLYEREGFVELSRRAVVAGDWDARYSEWILLTKGAGTVAEPEDDR